MATQKTARHSRFSTRRMALLGLVLIALGVVGWLQYIGAAGISGMATKDMDWDQDVSVTQAEILQSFHSVSVKQSHEGRRECSSYYWRADQRLIRMDCRTSMEGDK
ncbi:MAG: EF-hand domain-containing protein [Pseudoxanthomonas sp.]